MEGDRFADRVSHAWDDVLVPLTFRQATLLAQVLAAPASESLRQLAADFLAASAEDALTAEGPADGRALLLWQQLESEYAAAKPSSS